MPPNSRFSHLLALSSLALVLLAPVGTCLAQPQPACPDNLGDCDADGLGDNADNCTLVFNPDQRDSNNDGFGNLCDPDFNDDQTINSADLAIMKANFFSPVNPDTDMSGDSYTNFTDLGLLKLMFFDNPGPSGVNPLQPPCNCYFSADCVSGMFCDFGPGGLLTEDICAWRLPKPGGVAGTNCLWEYAGPGQLGLCDGYCVSPGQGSVLGSEDSVLITQGIELWANAVLVPSIAGGGPVDPEFAGRAMSLPFQSALVNMTLGRHVADLLSVASDFGFYDYFCHWESYPDDPGEFVDISGDTCRIEAARIATEALKTELVTPGSGAELVKQIPLFCADWQNQFSPRCEAGANALQCFATLVRETAEFLTTPSQQTVRVLRDPLYR